ncbi:MATE family efflux transporter [Halorarius litoreus]|uniref:MATE family efflux transporter n=1 Tax=Halorarius litoreus TaxID=2962676 RepID=UPI0020CE463F|nr:MATE family efflux transporter [Halorarius litoreus]
MSESSTESSITEGSLARPLFTLAWPIVVTQLLQVAYNIADTIWLGRTAEPAAAVGAISLAFPLIFLLLSVGGGFTVAGSTLVAQYTGAGGEESAGKAAGQTLAFVTVLAVFLGALGYVTTDPLLALLPADEETAAAVIPLAADYMRVFFLGTPFLFGFFVFSALMRGYGNTRTPMRVMFVTVVLNVVLDPFFIFGWSVFPAMGVEGAAVATLISRVVATGIGLYVLFGLHVGPDIRVEHLSLELDWVKKIVDIGAPSALEQSTSALAMITLTAMVVTFAPPVVAAYGLGNRLISLVFLPAMGLGRATNTMVGQNLGAEKPERAERAVKLAAGVGAGVMFGVALVALAFAEPIVGVFIESTTADAVETLREAAQYLRIRTVEFAFIGVLQVLLGAYRGAGNTKTALAFSLTALWIGRVPMVYYLAFIAGLGSTGIWIGMALGNVVGAIAAAAWFTRGTWKRSVVDTAAPDMGGQAVDGED